VVASTSAKVGDVHEVRVKITMAYACLEDDRWRLVPVATHDEEGGGVGWLRQL
jgi:hypothetical protein